MKYIILKIIFIIIIGFPTIGFTQMHSPFSYFITYDHQIGGFNSQYINFGGVTVGVSFKGLTIGGAFYGNYPYQYLNNFNKKRQVEILYGGILLGYTSPVRFVGMRANVLLGMGSIKDFVYRKEALTDYTFIISPSVYLDFHLWKGIILSTGVTYKYYGGVGDISKHLNLNYWKNALSFNISLGWAYEVRRRER